MGLRYRAGAMGIHQILELYPRATIHLFGFSHQGNNWHDWNAERDWCDSLVAAGRIHRHRSADNRIHNAMFSFKRGLVRFSNHVVNQHGETVLHYNPLRLLKKK